MARLALVALVAATLLSACESTAPREPSDKDILASLPTPGPLSWPARDTTRVASERNRRAQLAAEEEARREADQREEEDEEDEEDLLSYIEAWYPDESHGGTGAGGMFEVDDWPGDEKGLDEDELVIVPVPFANPTIGAGLYLIGGYIFRIDPEEEDAPPSAAGLAGMVSTNGSWGVGLGGSFHVDEDRWRILTALAYADVNYKLYGIGQQLGLEGRSVDISQSVLGLEVDVLRYLGSSMYLGPVFRAFTVDTDLNKGRPFEFGRFRLNIPTVRTREVSAGLEFTRDTRDDKFYPRRGDHLDLQARVYSEGLGGDHDYRVYTAAWSLYHSLANRTVLAGRGYGRLADGDVPFYALSYLGAGSDIRGYEVGRYQDRILLAFQAEIRQELAHHFGVEVFGGVGQVADRMGDFRLNDFLPGVGAGVTYTVTDKSHVNMRADVAWGVDGWVFYLGVGQAF